MGYRTHDDGRRCGDWPCLREVPGTGCVSCCCIAPSRPHDEGAPHFKCVAGRAGRQRYESAMSSSVCATRATRVARTYSRAVLYITSTLEKTCRIEIPAPHSTSRQCTSARRAARCAQAHSVHSSGSHVAVVLVSSHVAVVVLVSTSRRASCSSAQCAQQR